MLDFVDFFLSYVVINGMVPGHVEQWVTVFDMADVKLYELPFRLIKLLTLRGRTHFK